MQQNVHAPTNTTINNMINDNTTVPRVLEDPINICFQRVANHDNIPLSSTPKVYTNLTRNPSKYRRDAKK